MAGYIYIFTNPGFDQYVKIGYAENWERRLKELSNKSSVPYAFRCYATYKVDRKLQDTILHNLIDQLNPDLRTVDNINGKKRKREFYEMTPEQAFNILKAISVITNTEKRLKKIPESKINKEEEKKAREDKRPPFKFSMVSLKKGDKVYFKNNKKKMAIIIDDTHVQYGNVTFSLSTLAQELGKFKQRPQGPAYFVDSKGKTLDELRKEKEDQ